MKLAIEQKKTNNPYGKTLDVSTIKDLLVMKLEYDDYGYAENIYNPKCPQHQAKEKANKILMKDFQKKTKRIQNKHRKDWKSLPYGEVISVEITFPKVTFIKVTQFLVEYKIPFSIVDYANIPEEDMQEEIDFNNRKNRYEGVEEAYENLYKEEAYDPPYNPETEKNGGGLK